MCSTTRNRHQWYHDWCLTGLRSRARMEAPQTRWASSSQGDLKVLSNRACSIGMGGDGSGGPMPAPSCSRCGRCGRCCKPAHPMLPCNASAINQSSGLKLHNTLRAFLVQDTPATRQACDGLALPERRFSAAAGANVCCCHIHCRHHRLACTHGAAFNQPAHAVAQRNLPGGLFSNHTHATYVTYAIAAQTGVW
jgi:hypothetical protein